MLNVKIVLVVVLSERDFFVSMTDLAGSRDSSFRDTLVDPERCSRVVASAGHSINQCSKVCWPAPHFGHVGSTNGSMTCRYARCRLLWLEQSCASINMKEKHKDDNDWVKRCITWQDEGVKTEDARKTWWDGVEDDAESLGLSQKVVSK